jgi:hypothetical protein
MKAVEPRIEEWRDAMLDVLRAPRAKTRRTSTTLGIALITLWFGGHAAANAAQTPATENMGSTAEDGLQRIPIRGSGTFWVRPEVDLRAYDRVALKPIRVEYKGNPRHYRIDPVLRGVLLTERDRERLQQTFYDAFKTGLASGEGFGPASQPEPRLLWVSTSLLNVVVRNNDDTPTGNELHMINNFGEMTLRVEFSDAETGETVARFEERRTIGASGDFVNSVFRKDGLSYWTAVRANLRRWSELVRQRMHDQRAGAMQF